MNIEEMTLLKDFVEGKIQRDKLENYRGSYKLGFFYTKDLQKAIETLLTAYEKEKEKNKNLEIEFEIKKYCKVNELASDLIYYKNLAREYQGNCISKDKLKEIVDECIPKKENIITRELEYTPNANANSYLTQEILSLLKEE